MEDFTPEQLQAILARQREVLKTRKALFDAGGGRPVEDPDRYADPIGFTADGKKLEATTGGTAPEKASEPENPADPPSPAQGRDLD